jgi:hypothetical protein
MAGRGSLIASSERAISMRYRSSTAAVVPVLIALGLFATACDSTTPRGPGSIFISSSTSSAEPGNFFQYQITVDDGAPKQASAFENVSYLVNGLAHGSHKVRISGLPSVCNAGANERDISLRGDDTALVVFNIACARTTGDLMITVATSGTDRDTDGYLVLLDGFPTTTLPPNGQFTFPYVPAGSYTVGLAGVSTNCAASGPSSATIAVGATTTVHYTVSCSPVAIVKLTTAVTGDDRDADGVVFELGSSISIRAPVGTSYLRVPAGTHSWALKDVQPNCTMNAPSGSTTLLAGDTLSIAASATCSAIGYGTAGTVVADGEADTLQNIGNNPNKAHDILQFTTRYADNWIILVARFKQAVGVVGSQSESGLQGLIELDVDENLSTGVPPLVNGFGGNSQQGVDYSIVLFEADANSVRLVKVQSQDTTTHRVPLKVEGDSVIVRIPLAKLGGDNGNMTITSIMGTQDRPTDLLPNSGVIVARPASAAIVAAIVGAEAPLPASMRVKAAWGNAGSRERRK